MQENFKKRNIDFNMVILARGGSKGIPRKNLQKINGHSLVARSIMSAKQCKTIRNVIVSSDCKKVLIEAEKYGAITHLRKKYAATDNASTEDALDEFLNNFDKDKNFNDQFFGYIQPTSPFIIPEEIDQSFKYITKNKKISTVFSGRLTHSFLWRNNRKKGISEGINHNFFFQRSRRQNQKEKQFEETGAFYILRINDYLTTRNRFGNNPMVWPTSMICPIDIDTIEDLQICRKVSVLYDKEFNFEKPSAIFFNLESIFNIKKILKNNKVSFEKRILKEELKAIHKLRKSNIHLITFCKHKEMFPSDLAKKIGLHVIYNVTNKKKSLICFIKKMNINICKTVYIGDKKSDLPAMQITGLSMLTMNAPQKLHNEGFRLIPLNTNEGILRFYADSLF